MDRYLTLDGTLHLPPVEYLQRPTLTSSSRPAIQFKTSEIQTVSSSRNFDLGFKDVGRRANGLEIATGHRGLSFHSSSDTSKFVNTYTRTPNSNIARKQVTVQRS